MLCDVCLISPSDIYREGLSHILSSEGFNIVGSHQNISSISYDDIESQFLSVVDCPKPETQLETVSLLAERFPGAIIVVLSEHFDMKTMVSCFQAGANGYIVKSVQSLPLIASLRLAALGEKVLPSELVEMLDGQSLDQRLAIDIEHDIEDTKLSPRELGVLCCLMAGYSNKVIARQLDVCEATVKVHVKAILRKLNVRNRTQAAIWANSRGITEAHLVP